LIQDFRQRLGFQEYAQEKMTSRRIAQLARLTVAILFIYLLAFWYLQIVEGEHYARLSEENRIKRITVSAPRGAIFDRAGRVLVRSRQSFSVVVDPDAAEDWGAELEMLAAGLGTTAEEVRLRFEQAAREQASFEPVVVAEDVDLGAVAYVEARRADLRGVSVEVEQRRSYEAGASGAHLIGYVGEVSAAELETGRVPGARRGDLVGKAGLEKHLDSRLRGRNGYRQVVVNNVGRETGDLAGGVPAEAGENVRVSVDAELQRALELAFGPSSGAAVFLDPRTGEVLALTSRPGFDPNLFVRRVNRALWRTLVSDPRHPLQNRALQSAFSPGSTFKLIVASAALTERLISPSTKFFCGGRARFHGRTFHCHQRGGHGLVDLHDAIAKSCNIYFYNVGSELGIDRIAVHARRYGLGTPTGIGLGYEAAGLVPDPAWKERTRGERWYPSETVSVSIGQGPILVTPFQQAMVAAALATDGTRPAPRLRPAEDPVKAGRADGAPGRRGTPLDTAILDVIRRGMWGVVHENGTGWRARIPGADLCGKTGTAQVVAASADTKDEEDLPPEHRDHSWFIGFAPLRNPEVAFAVFVEHGGHGSEAAAPLARRVLEVFFSNRPRPPEAAPTPELARGSTGTETRVF
jgi:penicillin-binding protein 2